MSLVGNLEDLGLDDILQIVSLSRKSGLLWLQGDPGKGRILFRQGLVQAAFIEGEAADLRGLVVGGGFASPVDFDLATQDAAERGIPLDEAVAERTGLDAERLNALRREHAERSVIQMFRWRRGEFRFEIRDEFDPGDVELLLPTGINAQFLTMEATRLSDEDPSAESGGHGLEGGEATDEDDGAMFSGEEADDTIPVVTAEPAPPEAPQAHPETARARTLVAIDPELAALEWLKTVAGGIFERVHIFQRPETGVGRVRQYLGRAELPLLLVSSECPADPMTGARDVAELVARLKSQTPRMPIVALVPDHAEAPPASAGFDAVARRPASVYLQDVRRWSRCEDAADALRGQLERFAEAPLAGEPLDDAPESSAADRLQQLSERIHDPSQSGAVLSLVLEFAAESFARVAMFMVRDDVAVGLAQLGLEGSGGPDDEAMRSIHVGADEPAWFRAVLEGGTAVRSGPSDEGDARLIELLGGGVPSEAFVAPIRSGDRIVTLLYADQYPEGTPLGDTSALETVLSEAGLALDRAASERARSELASP